MTNVPGNRTATRPVLDKPTVSTETVRHEPFCLPQDGQDGPRIEQYPGSRGDGPGAVPLLITRCIECGAQKHEEKFNG